MVFVLTCNASAAARLAASWPCAASTAARADDSWVCGIHHGTNQDGNTSFAQRPMHHDTTACWSHTCSCTTQSVAFSLRLAKARRRQLHPCRAEGILPIYIVYRIRVSVLP